MNLLVTTAAKKYIYSKGGKATAKLKQRGPEDFGRPTVKLGVPKESELSEYKEIDIGNNMKLYVHLTFLNLDDLYNPRIDVSWGITGRGLVVKGF